MKTRPGSFTDLRALREALLERQREHVERPASPAPDRAGRSEAHGANPFALAVGPVTRLPPRAHADVRRPAPEAQPLQRRLDERAALAASLSGTFDIESLLDTDEALSYRRAGISPDVVRKLRRGHWNIQAQIDLHGLTRERARNELAAFFAVALRDGLRCVRVVHGKGLGSPGRMPVLKSHVRRWLVQRSEVLAFAQARPADGGAGALVVLLAAGKGASVAAARQAPFKN